MQTLKNLKQFKNINQVFQKIQFSFASFYENLDLSTNDKTFYASDLKTSLNPMRQQLPEWSPETLRFGENHSDHLLIIDYDRSTGWKKPEIVPFANFSIHPFNSSLHYAIQCFDGMKCYRTEKGIRFFRAESNMYRMKKSMQSIALPDFDGKEFFKCIQELVKVDQQWVPQTDKRGFSLYLRPTGIAMEDSLGVKIPNKARLYCALSPVGPYYPKGFMPIKLYCDPQKFRAPPHGTGNMKIGGNYGPTIPVSTQAAKEKYDQVLWLWKDEVCEVGTSNIFFYWINEQGEEELVTPTLDSGYILPGVTRDSVLDIARTWGRFKVTERVIKMEEVIKAINEGRLIEAFGAGTAVIVCPIELFNYKGQNYSVPIDPKIGAGKLTAELLNYIQEVQYGIRDHKNWAFDMEV